MLRGKRMVFIWISWSQVIPVILNRCGSNTNVYELPKCSRIWDSRGKGESGRSGKKRGTGHRERKNGSAPGFNQWFRRHPGVSVKKNARAARTTTEIRIVIRSAVVPSSRMHPPSLSLFLADTRDLVAPRLFVRHPVRSRTSFLLRAPPTSSAFCFLLSNVVAVRHPGSHPGAKCDTRRSLVNVRSTMEKSCVYDVVSSTESNFYLHDDERGHTYALERFSWWKNWWQSIGIAFSINGHFRLHLRNYTHVRMHTQFIQV